MTEIYAIGAAAGALLEAGAVGKAIIYSDSQGALRAVANPRTTSKVLSECKQVIKELGRVCYLKLK